MAAKDLRGAIELFGETHGGIESLVEAFRERMLTIVRMIAAGIAVLAGLWVVGANWYMLILNGRNERNAIDRHHSFVPFLGPLLGAIGVAVAPMTVPFWLSLPFLLDIGTIAALLFLPVAFLSWVRDRLGRSNR